MVQTQTSETIKTRGHVAPSVPPRYKNIGLSKEARQNMQCLIGLALQDKQLPPPFDGSNPIVARIQNNGGNWQALDAMYNLTPEDRLEPWLNILNIQAIYNRKELVRSILEELFSANLGRDIRILELAAGSAQALLEAMENTEHSKVHAHLVDIDPVALQKAQGLARIHGVSNQVETTCSRVLVAGSTARGFQPNIIEMVGLADYLPDRVMLRLLKQFCSWLPQGGIFVIGNVLTENPEEAFIHGPYRWPRMTYRTMQQLQNLAEQAGFSIQGSVMEPHKIHGIVVAQKE